MKTLSRLRNLSLRYQVSLGVAVGFLLFFGLLAYLAATNVQRAANAAFQGRLLQAETTASTVDSLLYHAHHQLEQLASLSEEGNTGSAAQANLETLIREVRGDFHVMGTFTAIAIVDSQGRILDSVASGMPLSTSNLANHPVVRKVFDTGRPVMGSAEVTTIPHPPIVIVAAPVRGSYKEGSLALVGELHLSHMGISLVPLPAGGKTFTTEVVNGQGLVAASSTIEDEAKQVARSRHYALVADLMTAHMSGVRIHEDPREPHHIVAYAPLLALIDGSGVIIEETEDVAMAVPTDLRRDMALVGLVALGLASAGAWLHALSVVGPLGMLASSTRQIAAGALDAPIRVSRGDEIGTLAHSFEAMRVQLKEAQEAQRRWERELEERVRQRTQESDWLLGKTITAQEEERQRIARELHDSVVQSMATLTVTLQAMRNALPPNLARERDVMAQAVAQGTQALTDIRRMIADLRPSALDDLGFVPALQAYAQERLEAAGVRVHLEVMGQERRLAGPVETALFRILQEAITNIAKHAHARNVMLRLTFDTAAVGALVEDDGLGFDLSAQRTASARVGVGLQSMRERATLIGGMLSVESEPGRGTRVRIGVPLK